MTTELQGLLDIPFQGNRSPVRCEQCNRLSIFYLSILGRVTLLFIFFRRRHREHGFFSVFSVYSVENKNRFMRKISLIIVHCSANKEGSTLRMADIDRYHRSLGWKGCGYHYVIPTDGTIEVGRPEEVKGAHCKNHNNHSIGVCYVGGLAADGKTPKDTRTEEQKRALRMLLEDLHKRYPKALIVGHCDLDPKKPCCPGFDVINENGNENDNENEKYSMT